MQKLLNRFYKIRGKVGHEPRKKPLDFDSNPYRVTSELGLGYG